MFTQTWIAAKFDIAFDILPEERGRRSYSYRSRYRGSLAPLFPSSLETLYESGLSSSNVKLSFLSFFKFLFLVFNLHTNSYHAFEATIG